MLILVNDYKIQRLPYPFLRILWEKSKQKHFTCLSSKPSSAAMHTFVMALPNPSLPGNNVLTANYSTIPSSLSLKSNAAPLQNLQGKVENLYLISLSEQGKLDQVHRFFQQMDSAGVSVSLQTYQHLLQTCGNLQSLHHGRLIHERIRTQFQNPPGFLHNWLLKMYCECGSTWDAEKLFDEMPERCPLSWAIMMSAFAGQGWTGKVLAMFLKMKDLGINATPSIYISLLKSLLDSSLLDLGKQLHSQVIKSGFHGNVAMDTAVSNMYVKCGCLESAEWAFQKMEERNVITWTALMVGLTRAERKEDALRLFHRMVREDMEFDDFVFSITLKACAGLRDIILGLQVHGLLAKLGLESQVTVGSALVDFYVKCGDIDSANQAFERISEPNDVSWSAMIHGYTQIGDFEKCFEVFKSLRREGVVLNEFIYTNIFQACSALADLNLGTQVHGDAVKRRLVSYLHGESAMITMYGKCGQLDSAFQVFESMIVPDIVAWTSIIAACAYHGYASEALSLFRRMRTSGVRPNEVTFIAILTACSHSGLIKEAKQFLELMSTEYGLAPTIDHYDCLVDSYARAGQLNEALDLIQTMPFEPDAMSWKSLLGGCSIHRNFELGKIAAEKLLELDPQDTAAYILMFNLYASCGKWDEAASIRRMMAERDLKKEVGCSWITVKGKVHRFIVGDRHHPQTEEIYQKLEELKFSRDNINNAVLVSDGNNVSNELPQRKEQLLDHSERLAIAFGLIATPNDATILVFKNLRACKDCHEFAKHASLVTGRGITVRDANRFHHFRDGKCSCGDYW
ncbi:hypothetical protein M9H77_10393 [Catharanthus roseus]|uniref:Uncharacterized protein n=1 Tax=Catharanthus roseus TaxID=4058 RepID=A0ACC0C3S3_CATRO|nr:hypothetical protein M9H77_10393 [Catharanthus roseus]